MEKVMRKMLGYVALGLPVACAFQMALPARAQHAGQLAAPATVWVSEQAPGQINSSPDVAVSTLEELNVQLAWLADPSTFPFSLTAKAGPGGLEVRGYVPSEAVRQHAMQTAREHCSLPVIDSLNLHTQLALRFVSPAPAADIEHAAHSFLTEA